MEQDNLKKLKTIQNANIELIKTCSTSDNQNLKDLMPSYISTLEMYQKVLKEKIDMISKSENNKPTENNPVHL
jgi:hypothetical protein